MQKLTLSDLIIALEVSGKVDAGHSLFCDTSTLAFGYRVGTRQFLINLSLLSNLTLNSDLPCLRRWNPFNYLTNA